MSWLTDPALVRIWDVLRERLEARGLRAEGRVVLTGLSREERHAVSVLVGRPVITSRLAVDLAVLDAALADRSEVGGLRAVLEDVTGSALQDRPALKAQRVADRAAPFTLARSLLAPAPWVEEWLEGVRRSGVLPRTSDPTAAVRHAAATLCRLPVAMSRTELATAVAGDAHALDDGTAAAALVLRALAAQAGEPVPTSTLERRALWERFGVRVDLVSTTCLTLGLRATDRGGAAARLALAADAGDPVHLTPWDLRRCDLAVPGAVLVCENPRVLEAAAERHGGRVAVVCTSGQPALVVLDVLRALAGAELRYHGDFDWPGVAIANRLVAEAGVVPWRMGVAEYLDALGPARLPLAGVAVEPVWDAELGAAMRHHGVAVHEEAVLEDLLAAVG
ncbi:TIGR02679 family protein [Pseudonocardia sp. H11422]|uniref:TIGR02679 family protein n=1 Tax=Pseudonocardia sp. H11422 TaxID=2835866 RepID=UPI001BDBF74B|nr:TIGR02679 family protein [Pseudonocardia sp. H11422]